MVKDKTAALERAKKATGAAKGKKQNRGSSSRAGLPPGWIQGDWIRSSLRQEDLDELVESGLIAKGAARLPEGETEPQPRPGECVLLATHVDRGFSLPPHPFFRGFLNFFGAQLHHFLPIPSRTLPRSWRCVKTFWGVDRTRVFSNIFSPSVPSR